MRQASYTDPEGRRWAVMLPEGAPDHAAARGVPVGPPSLEDLHLPLDIEVRLHNELHNRGIFTYQDARRRSAEIFAAWQAALKVDVQRIQTCYYRPPDPEPAKNGRVRLTGGGVAT